MGRASDNLTGQWDGTYFYPDVPEAGPVTPFLANVTETGGSLSGSTIEPHEWTGQTIRATFNGYRTGKAVYFAKKYSEPDDDYRETVLYFGQLSADGQMITGEWRIGHWQGRFEMVRQAAVETKAEAKLTAFVD